ncbi:MAG: septum formation initiator family protein [Clostridia bacterium]|nr:septum formation initiator family protein [Clostridia bacterium]MBR3954285.1 septum formation initiator family protein [Clostridia bacterium]
MGTIFKSRKHSILVIFAVILAICVMLFLFLSTQSEVKAQEDKLAALESQYASVSEENAQYEHILNESDEREQYEYQARELGYGYPDETKVINVTPGK